MKTLLPTMALAQPYYAFCPAPGWRAIVLHSADLCSQAVDATDEEKELLKRIVREEGRMSHHYHGAVGPQQLQWFREQLDHAVLAKERVIVFSHYPLAEGSATNSHVLANTTAIREIIERPGSPVMLCMAGHDHMGSLMPREFLLLLILPS